MEFEYSEKVRKLQARIEAFMAEHIYPNEEELFAQVNEGDRWQPVALLEELKAKSRAAELWNLFLPESEYGAVLTNLEYAPLCEIMRRSPWAPRPSTSPPPTPATWNSLLPTAPPNNPRRGPSPCSARGTPRTLP